MKMSTKIMIIAAGAAIGGLNASVLVWPPYAAIFSGASSLISLVIVTLTGISLVKGN